jgi:hypothetical protein
MIPSRTALLGPERALDSAGWGSGGWGGEGGDLASCETFVFRKSVCKWQTKHMFLGQNYMRSHLAISERPVRL